MGTLVAVKPAVVSVPYRDDELHAVRLGDDKIGVVIKRICESLGVDFSSQLQKLKRHHWATVAMIATVDASGREREVCVLPLDRLPMWLATIDVRKVGEPVREKLKAYQLEAADALARHFFGKGASGLAIAAPQKDPLLAQCEALCEVVRRQLDQERRITTVEVETEAVKAIAESASAKADAALASSSGQTGFLTLLGYCNLHKIQLTRAEMAKVGQTLRKACDSVGVAVRAVPHETYGKVNVYPVEILDQWHHACHESN